jgi:PleD family two-component response regulator
LYGHPAGDLVLKKTSKEMTGCIRKEKDWVARYGGEEFQYEDKSISITASFEVYTIYGDTDFFSMEDLMKRVDDKLYQAKKEGRNKVV